MSDSIRLTDEVPCYVRSGHEEVPAFLHPTLSNQQMAKVCYEDGTYRDIFWGKIRRVGVPEAMDEYEWDEEEDDNGA